MPKLKGKGLKAARKALYRADCKLGKVKRREGRHGRVIGQRPKPGRALASGAKVSVFVGR